MHVLISSKLKQGETMSKSSTQPVDERTYRDHLYTAAETAAVLGVRRNQVLAWIEDEVLPSVRLGHEQQIIRVQENDLKRFIEEDFVPSVPPGHGGSLRRS
jgi:excisionase family DNA binding protein